MLHTAILPYYRQLTSRPNPGMARLWASQLRRLVRSGALVHISWGVYARATPLAGLTREPAGEHIIRAAASLLTLGEADGAVKYANPVRATARLRRDAELRAAGFEVVHFTWEEITHVPARVAAAIRTAFGRANRSR